MASFSFSFSSVGCLPYVASSCCSRDHTLTSVLITCVLRQHGTMLATLVARRGLAKAAGGCIVWSVIKSILD